MAKNQCDGCARGMPLRDGIHYGRSTIRRNRAYDMIGCTAHRYKEGGPVLTIQEQEHAMIRVLVRVLAEYSFTPVRVDDEDGERTKLHAGSADEIITLYDATGIARLRFTSEYLYGLHTVWLIPGNGWDVLHDWNNTYGFYAAVCVADDAMDAVRNSIADLLEGSNDA